MEKKNWINENDFDKLVIIKIQVYFFELINVSAVEKCQLVNSQNLKLKNGFLCFGTCCFSACGCAWSLIAPCWG
jgi:hypothetical protein